MSNQAIRATLEGWGSDWASLRHLGSPAEGSQPRHGGQGRFPRRNKAFGMGQPFLFSLHVFQFFVGRLNISVAILEIRSPPLPVFVAAVY